MVSLVVMWYCLHCLLFSCERVCYNWLGCTSQRRVIRGVVPLQLLLHGVVLLLSFVHVRNAGMFSYVRNQSIRCLVGCVSSQLQLHFHSPGGARVVFIRFSSNSPCYFLLVTVISCLFLNRPRPKPHFFFSGPAINPPQLRRNTTHKTSNRLVSNVN